MNISGSPTLSQLTIIGNRSDWQGGGIYNANGNPVLTNVTITGNQAGYGGGMYNNLEDTSPVLTKVMIRNNMPLEDVGCMFNNHLPSPGLTNVEIAGSYGGKLGGGVSFVDSFGSLTNVTMIDNTSRANCAGRGLYSRNSSCVIRNSIIWGNGSVADL